MTEAPGTWEDPPRRSPAAALSPVLAVAGFEGPLDWQLARTRRLDLRRLSILALVEAFGDAMATALMPALPVAELARWRGWMVMAAQLAELRSRLMLPAEDPRAQAGQAEAVRRQCISRAEVVAVADWLERQPQLGREVFACGRPDVRQAGAGRKGQEAARGTAATFVDDADGQDEVSHEEAGHDDLTELLRACLVALRLPAHAEAYQPQRPPFWSVADATTRIGQMLQALPDGGLLEVFLPALPEPGPEQAGHGQCRARRAAVAATLVTGTRDGTQRQPHPAAGRKLEADPPRLDQLERLPRLPVHGRAADRLTSQQAAVPRVPALCVLPRPQAAVSNDVGSKTE